MVRTLDSHSRESGFKSSCHHFEAWVVSFTLPCLNSLNCINEYLVNEDLAIDIG